MTAAVRSGEVVVVGGGVLGLAVAREALRAGATVTSIYSRERDIEAASRAAGAMLGAFGEVTADDDVDEVRELEFRLAAQRRYPDWLGELRQDSRLSVYQTKGTFVVANNDGSRDRASVKRMKMEAERLGEPAQWVDAEQVPGLAPSPSHIPGLCLHLPNEHSVDSAELMSALVQANSASPRARHLDDQVASIRREGGRFTITTRGGASLVTPAVVVCAGSRSWETLDPELRAAVRLPELYFGKGVSCIVRDAPRIPQTIRTPNRAFACGIHVVPRLAGARLYVGATNCMGTDHDKERGIQPGELHSLFDEIIHQINTGIRTSRIEELRYGYRPIAACRRPLLGKTAVPGLCIATGTYRNGILMSPLVASIVAHDLGLASTADTTNPFPAEPTEDQPAEPDFERLSAVGIRDIVSFLHEPRGALPYNRAAELEAYVKALFDMAMGANGKMGALRDEMREQMRLAPFNETMHRLFYEVVARSTARPS